MFNPLLANLSDLKQSELENKISDLSKKYFIASRSGNSGLAQQIAVVLEAHRMELQTKNLEANKIATKNGDTGLDDLIKVN